MKAFLTNILAILLLSSSVSIAANPASTGNDLLYKFQQARNGKPLRCVAIGGSITQAGQGWVSDWLQETFPDSNVVMHNAGMSATGSMLGMFRLERDVISCQPDLVLIEFAVNDGGADDESVYWTIESIVRRLKTLPNPPAIVFIEAASENKSKRYRHEKIAEHYGLLNIDLQEKSDAYLKQNNFEWNKLFSDNVHPNKDGHKFYAKAISEELKPFADKANGNISLNKSLPHQFCSRKLILDGRMVPIAIADGWKKENSLPSWWNMFFNKIVAADEPGTTMKIPFKGTIAGLFFALDKQYGFFYANVDGKGFKEVLCNNRGGYSYTVFQDLSPEEHVLNIALPENSQQGKGVKLGYLLLGGETDSNNTIALQGEISPKKLVKFALEPIDGSKWHWIGPFGDVSESWKNDKTLPYMNTIFQPESTKTDLNKKYEFMSRKMTWKKIETDKIDFGKLTDFKDRGICYATTTIQSPKDENVPFALRIDYWGKVWINGKLVLTVDKGHGSPLSPIFFDAELKKGENIILIKVQSGSLGNMFSLEKIKQ